jgi:hypothetical protein
MLTPEQLEARRSGIGASEIAALLLLDPYKGPRDIWLEKVHGFIPEEQPPRKTDAKDIGSCFEGGCLQLAEIRLGQPIQRENLRREVEGTKIVATLDAWIEADGMIVPVEAKTAGIVHPWGVDPDDWGADGTDHFPPKYIVQLHAQMMATGAKYGYLSAVIGGIGHRLYRCDLQDEIVGIILQVCDGFWQCVEDRVEPSGEPPRLESLKRLRRVPDSIVKIPREAIEPIVRWKSLGKQKAVVEAEQKAAQAEAIALLRTTDDEGNSTCFEGGWLELHFEDVEKLAAALEMPTDVASGYQKLTYSADKNGRRTLRLGRADDAFLEAAADAPLIDLKQHLIGGEI